MKVISKNIILKIKAYLLFVIFLYLQAHIFATLPTSQWAQLKRALRGAPGCGLIAAMKGWIKHRIVVAKPTEACIVSELHVPNSTNIITKAAIVIDHVSTIKNLCHLRKKLIRFYYGESCAKNTTWNALFYVI